MFQGYHQPVEHHDGLITQCSRNQVTATESLLPSVHCSEQEQSFCLLCIHWTSASIQSTNMSKSLQFIPCTMNPIALDARRLHQEAVISLAPCHVMAGDDSSEPCWLGLLELLLISFPPISYKQLNWGFFNLFITCDTAFTHNWEVCLVVDLRGLPYAILCGDTLNIVNETL